MRKICSTVRDRTRRLHIFTHHKCVRSTTYMSMFFAFAYLHICMAANLVVWNFQYFTCAVVVVVLVVYMIK